MVEQRTENPCVGSSNLPQIEMKTTILLTIAIWGLFQLIIQQKPAPSLPSLTGELVSLAHINIELIQLEIDFNIYQILKYDEDDVLKFSEFLKPKHDTSKIIDYSAFFYEKPSKIDYQVFFDKDVSNLSEVLKSKYDISKIDYRVLDPNYKPTPKENIEDKLSLEEIFALEVDDWLNGEEYDAFKELLEEVPFLKDLCTFLNISWFLISLYGTFYIIFLHFCIFYGF